jgi:glutamate--cysteine ligase
MGHRPTVEDWETHVSTLFPDVRLKTFLEMRTADSVPPQYVCALPALWKGVLYSNDHRAAAWDLVKAWSFDERLQHRESVARDALDTPVPRSKAKTSELARELLAIARDGLEAIAVAAGHEVETAYLAPLEALVREGRTPGDEMRAAWREGISGRTLLAKLMDLHVSKA